jgi:hypothetical protein
MTITTKLMVFVMVGKRVKTKATMMNLPSIFSNENKNGATLAHEFFVIQISDAQVESALWKVEHGTVEIVTSSEAQAWKDENTCLNAVDVSLQELGKESENVKLALFSLSSDWVTADGIASEKKQFFQKMTKELSLEPIGFVVTVEALTQYLIQDSPQLSIFLIEVSAQHLHVTLMKAGQVASSFKVGRSGEAVSDLTEGLAHFSEKVFPSKMLLFSTGLSTEEINEVQQQLLAHDWVSAYPFLHAPVIEVFEEPSLLEVVVQTGGRAVAEAKGLLKTAETGTETAPQAMSEAMSAEVEEAENVEPATASEFGFANALPETNQNTAIAPVEQKAVEKAVEEVTEEPMEEAPRDLSSHNISASTEKKSIEHEGQQAERSGPAQHHLKPWTASFWKAHAHLVLFGVALGVLVLAVFAYVASKQLTSAVVKITLHTQPVSTDVLLTLDPKATVSDPDKLILKADVVAKEEEDDQTAETTGTKLIGDKAKGTVTVLNYTNSEKTFSAGTKLSVGKVSFSLDQSTTVPAATTTIDSSNNKLTKPGSTDATVTASQIGEDSNLGAGIDLTIESFAKDSYFATAKAALAGGSSRQTQAVSQQDKDALTAALKKKLTDQALQDLKTSSGNTGVYLVPTNKTKVVTAQYSADVGKETSSLSLHMKLQVEALSYTAADLQPLAQQVLSKQVPDGFQLSAADPQVLSSVTAAVGSPASSASSTGPTGSTTATGSAATKAQAQTPTSTQTPLTLSTNISSVAVPVIDSEAWKKELLGKSLQQAEAVLKAKKEVQAEQILLSPAVFAALFHTLPSQAGRLTLTVVGQK